MSLCLMLGATALALASPDFSLRWTHSVEKTDWVEEWRVEAGALHLTRVAIKGSGAGMEPDPAARLEGGWWVWQPGTVLAQITLAASGATGAGWTLCHAGGCTALGTSPGAPITLRPCEEDNG